MTTITDPRLRDPATAARGRWLMLIVLLAGQFMALLDVVQGAGAAAMMPQIMSVIQVRFDGAARARALSAYTAVLSSGFVAGQVVGGVLVTANLFGQTWRPRCS